MSAPALHAIHGGTGAAQPPWAEKDEKELRETLEEALRDSEHITIVYVERLPDSKTRHVWCRNMRGTRTSFFEMVGVMGQVVADWLRGDG